MIEDPKWNLIRQTRAADLSPLSAGIKQKRKAKVSVDKLESSITGDAKNKIQKEK